MPAKFNIIPQCEIKPVVVKTCLHGEHSDFVLSGSTKVCKEKPTFSTINPALEDLTGVELRNDT